MDEHPIRLLVDDDLRRTRLTVFFRLLLAIPHLVLVSLWATLATILAVVNWGASLVTGRSPDALHAFLARFLRYATHVTAYLHLLADPYPGFSGSNRYPVDLDVAPPEDQNRWLTAFRLVLAIPAFILASVLGYVAGAIAFLGWFACLALGRMPKGMRDLGAYCVRYTLQTYAYALILTERYPSLSWEAPGDAAQASTP